MLYISESVWEVPGGKSAQSGHTRQYHSPCFHKHWGTSNWDEWDVTAFVVGPFHRITCRWWPSSVTLTEGDLDSRPCIWSLLYSFYVWCLSAQFHQYSSVVLLCFINQAVTFNLPRLPLSSLDPLCDRNEDENEEIIFSFGWNIFLKGQFTPKNTYYLDPVDLHSMGKNCLNILQNILFCVPQKKERHSGLKWHKAV